MYVGKSEGGVIEWDRLVFGLHWLWYQAGGRESVDQVWAGVCEAFA